MKTLTKLFTTLLVAILFAGTSGCDTTPKPLTEDDFKYAATLMVQDLIQSKRLVHPGGGRYVMETGSIFNKTKERISVDQVMVKIKQDLTNSGQVVFTSLNNGDYIISGQILQRDTPLGGGKFRKDYYFQLQITDMRTGFDFWIKEEVISREGRRSL